MTDTLDVPLVRRLSDLGRADIAVVGGKNASLGEMIGKLQGAGIKVPGGFATTAAAYWQLLEHNKLKEPISAKLAELAGDAHNLAVVGKAVREIMLAAQRPAGRELRRPARELPQRARRARAARRLQALLRVAFHRPRDRLPPQPRLRPHE